MARVFKRTCVRPSIDVPWCSDVIPSDFNDEVKIRYQDTGKVSWTPYVESEDGLSRAKIITWVSEEAYAEYEEFRHSYTGTDAEKEHMIEYYSQHGMTFYYEDITDQQV